MKRLALALFALALSFSHAIYAQPNPPMDIFWMRGLERILVVVGAIIFGYLGYRLYVLGISGTQSKVNFNSQLMKFAASGTGPGLLFMIFGAVVLVFSLALGGTREIVSTERVEKSTESHSNAAVSSSGSSKDVIERKTVEKMQKKSADRTMKKE